MVWSVLHLCKFLREMVRLVAPIDSRMGIVDYKAFSTDNNLMPLAWLSEVPLPLVVPLIFLIYKLCPYLGSIGRLTTCMPQTFILN